MRYCILGGGGVFGLNCAHYLKRQGHEVFGIGRSAMRSDCWTGGNPYVQYDEAHVFYDSMNVAQLIDEDYNADVVVNFAAQGEGAASFDPRTWHLFFNTNCSGLTRVIGELIERAWPGKFIHIGSSEVYGSVFTPASEEHPIRPSSPYSASKAGFDLFLMSICENLKFPGIIVRPSNCYCPGQQLHRIIPRAFLAALSGAKLPLHGGGLAEKSYLHARDLSAAIAILAERGEAGQVYNVGPDMYISIRELVGMIALQCGMTFDELVEEVPERTSQDSRYWLTSRKMKALGWEPEISLEQGLVDMHKWVQDNLAELRASPQEFRMRA